VRGPLPVDLGATSSGVGGVDILVNEGGGVGSGGGAEAGVGGCETCGICDTFLGRLIFSHPLAAYATEYYGQRQFITYSCPRR